MGNTNETKEVGKTLRVVFGDVVLGVHGEGFRCLFSYETGGMESLVINGREWLYRTPKPTFWRASTDNDKGSGFPFQSSAWLGADLFLRTEAIDIAVDGRPAGAFLAPDNNRFMGEVAAEEVKVTFTYLTSTTPRARVEVSYTVEGGGHIRTAVHYRGEKGLPQLPVFGIRFILPDLAAGYVYQGLSGETYPDRMAGGVRGIYETAGLPVTPYLVPQDCGVHMETEFLTVIRKTLAPGREEQSALTFSMEGRPFAFTCLPYTAEELENALHQEELPLPRRTVVCILGAVRGVGGIDSWGSEVEEEYRIDATKDIVYSFYIETQRDERDLSPSSIL